MHHYSQGKCTRQGHKGIPDGLYEEEQGLQGFFGPVSHLIRKNPCTRWSGIDGPLKPRLFDVAQWNDKSGESRLLYNSQVTISYECVHPLAPKSELVANRDADGDLVFFCHQGEGHILTDYGLLNYSAGHYVVIPKCIAYTVLPKKKTLFLKIESRTSHYEEPERGIVGRHAVYDINALGKPDLEAMHAHLQGLKSPVRKINIKHNDQNTTYTYDECIYDVIGWKGDLFPFTLHTDHMMPLMSHRAHLPPSAHTTFVAKDFVICTFLPRPIEKDKDALKVPFNHQNIDYDEVLFYHKGDFFSRDNLHAGMMSFHPAGFAHGPHPKATESIESKEETNEYAIMIDTRFPLIKDDGIDSIEVKDYWKSWQKK